MPDADLETLLAFFKAMANESRLKIVGLLAERERSGQELAELLGLKEPTVSHHLAVLKDLGLVSARAEGVTRWHRLEPGALTEMNRALLDPRDVASLAKGSENWEDKVLASFLDGEGRLKLIPASRRKRWVVLKWLAAQFEEGRRYPEAEVNALIQARHWDCATLRRELIGHAMLAREAGVYWRLPEAQWKGFEMGMRG
jgi:hypothetical protein